MMTTGARGFGSMRSAAGLIAALSVALLSGSAASDASTRLPGEGESCGSGESPDYFAARYQWYLERYGVNGVFDPESAFARCARPTPNTAARSTPDVVRRLRARSRAAPLRTVLLQ